MSDLSDDELVEQTTTDLARLLTGVDRLGVAFSGGVDSSVLLALAARALGVEQVVALLGCLAQPGDPGAARPPMPWRRRSASGSSK